MTNILKWCSFKQLIVCQTKNYSNFSDSNLKFLLEIMPKEQKHIAEAQRQRKKIKEKFSKYVPGRVTLQILGTGAPGAPRSLYVFSDQSRYLFNCGEGTQRLAHEHKMKLAKLEHIFITQPVWRNIGGLPGTALTIQDVGVPHITLHGPKGLNEIFTATRRFVIIRDLQIKMAECNENTKYEDNVMTVQYVPIVKSDCPIITEDDNFSKEIQVGGSGKLVDSGTSTRKEKRRGSQSSSRSCSPDLVAILEEDDTDYYAHERKRHKNRHRNRSRSNSRSRSPSVSGNRTALQQISQTSQLLLRESKEQGVSMAYICKLQPRPGALSPERCVKFGVPPGPLLGRLKAGEDVMLDNGVVVKSVDVCEPDDPGPVFIVIDCPTEEYLNSLVNNEAFKKHQAIAKDDANKAALVVHFTPQHVVNNAIYRQWVDQFSPNTQHILLNDSNKCMGSISVHRIQYKLNLLHNSLFPLLGDKGTNIDENQANAPATKRLKTVDTTLTENKSNGENCVQTSIENLSVNSGPASPRDPFINVGTFSSYHLRPKTGLDRSTELKLIPSEYIEETMNVEGFPEALQQLKHQLTEESSKHNVRPYPKLLFLGTGSCIPNKTRNTSGILLETSKKVKVLIDCGEGTYGQMVRFFGASKADEILTNIKAVFISHLHADHHIGLVGLLLGRRRSLDRLGLTADPVLLIAPKQILTWLNFYDRFFENVGKEFELVPCGDLLLDENTLQEGIKTRVLNSLELSDVNTVYVRHCPNAFGVAFEHKNGYKITYSGDTMPCQNLSILGKDSDLLIHEATMEDELAAEAVVKMHSTTSQAIEVGKQMNAKNIMLTHFSQRYAKLPRFNDNFTNDVGIAFDNMQVHLDELSLVPLLYPALKLMFAEHYEELEHKAVKRQLRMERQREASLDRQRSLDRRSLKS